MNILRAFTWALLLALMCVFIPLCHALLLVLPRGEYHGDK